MQYFKIKICVLTCVLRVYLCVCAFALEREMGRDRGEMVVSTPNLCTCNPSMRACVTV